MCPYVPLVAWHAHVTAWSRMRPQARAPVEDYSIEPLAVQSLAISGLQSVVNQLGTIQKTRSTPHPAMGPSPLVLAELVLPVFPSVPEGVHVLIRKLHIERITLLVWQKSGLGLWSHLSLPCAEMIRAAMHCEWSFLKVKEGK